MFEPNPDLEWAARIDAECRTGDAEGDHFEADKILCELLTRLGYVQTVAAWEKTKRWYS